MSLAFCSRPPSGLATRVEVMGENYSSISTYFLQASAWSSETIPSFVSVQLALGKTRAVNNSICVFFSVSGTVFLVYYTTAADLDPVPWLISEFAAANTASMVLFVGNPTNVVICEGFHINNAAFTAYTILPFLACSVACFAGLALQFRDSKHVPKKLKHSEKLNP